MPETKKKIPKTYIVERFDIDEEGLLEKFLAKNDKKGYDLHWIQEQTHSHDEAVIFKRRK